MKRILPLLLLAAFICIGQGPAASGEEAPPWAIVNNPNPEDRLHLREKPDTASSSLGRYYNGTAVERYSRYENDVWAHVSIGNRIGYMQKKFLAIGADPGAVQPAQPLMVVNNESSSAWLNLREEASQNSRVLGQFFNGKQVTVLGDLGDWLHVSVDGVIGFMMPAFLRAMEREEAEAASDAPAPAAAVTAAPKLRQFEVYASMDQGYSVAASAIEIGPSVFNVHVNIAFAPDYTTNDDIVRYALYVDGVRKADLEAFWASGNKLLAPTTFTATVTIGGAFRALSLVPVLEQGGEQRQEPVTLREVTR